MTELYSMHDRQGHSIVPSGGFGLDLIALSENPAPVNYSAINPNINWLVRVDWSNTGGGTFPIGENVDVYISRAFDFILKSSGFHGIILGNEPNHENERPNGAILEPEYVAWLFSTLRSGIKSANSSIRFITPAIAPYHASPDVWTHYLSTMLTNLQYHGGTDGIAIHAYARSMDPSEATSDAKMADAPLTGQYSSFRTYVDALNAVPGFYKTLPHYLTEFNVWPDWENKNTGIVKAVYKEIANHNSTGHQTIHCLTLFRWKHYDGQLWGLEDRPEVLKDFQEAIAQGAGGTIPDVEEPTVFIPSVSTGTTSPEEEYPLVFDPEAAARGVKIVPADPTEDDTYVWKTVKIDFLPEGNDPGEAQGTHHFYFDTLDENGNRLVGVDIKVSWSTDDTVVTSEGKPGEPYSANFPMSPGQNAFSAKVVSEWASDEVTGVGMGADTPEGYNPGIHTSTVAVFQRFFVLEEAEPVPPIPDTDVSLAHPVENPRFRYITQYFGENPNYYQRYSYDGVPLKGHNGLDFGTPVASVIVAVDAGTVIEMANDEDGYGLYVKMKHIWGESLYAHLSKQLVTVGQAIKKGQSVGLSGNTGVSTGPHLHFGLRINPYSRNDGWGGYSDPLPYLQDASLSETPEKPSSLTLEQIFKKVGEKYGLEWQLLASQAWAESSFDPSSLGKGLFQIEPGTWNEIAPKVNAKNILDPSDNAEVAAYYLRYLLGYYDGNIYNAVLAFNHGMGNVDNKVPTSEATRKYVDKVFHGRDLLKALGVK